ncbi:DoxX family protein [Afifella sp. YEN Y35]|uniref:DoxX family protein n=1 Tax=Afifella sp. YEN Y35 TaxID=3388337 RepID=UPI0039E055FD
MTTKDLETIWAPRVLSVVRIVAALLFMEHGTQKLLGFPPADHVTAAFSLGWYAGILEMCGGALLVIGLFTRPVAFVLSGLMAFAYFLAHFPRAFYPVLNGGDAAILFCFLFFYLVFAGPGPWSADAWRANKTFLPPRD